MGAIEELTKARDGWQKQKDNNLTDARIADASINALEAAIELVENDSKAKTKSEENQT